MYKIENIKQVHLEITEKCQAGCAMCGRTWGAGNVNPRLTMSELSLEDCKTIFPVEFVKQLHHIFLCGTFGDPAAAKDTLEVFKYFRECNPDLILTMHTNGGLRNTAWWTELAQVLSNRGSKVVFSVDGLQDTNHIYRQNVNWDIVESNMRTFISAGGNAVWEYLIFQHNQHQIEEARALSEEIGFKNILFKKSARFSGNLDSLKSDVTFKTRRGESVILAEPDSPHQNIEKTKQASVLTQYGTSENYYNTTPISCKAINESSIYITAEGLFLPCCWLAGPMYNWSDDNIDYKQNDVWKLIDKVGGKSKLDARKGLTNVFNSGILEMIEKGWSTDREHGRIFRCAQVCGIGYSPYSVEITK
jgi:MoaA/NifB/PqqE/SkfB family radical SAM enzyme